MRIINGTKRTINILTERGTVFSVAPGSKSDVTVASVNLIQSAINSGKPSEIGIVLSNSWELSVANQVSGGQPYYYTNEAEAVAKLIDPTVDYKISTELTQVQALKI